VKAASIHQIKKELSNRSPSEILEICLRLGKFKKDNKELITYLLFEAGDERAYINYVNEEVSHLFSEINSSNLYYTKKGLRKIVRYIDKCIRYSGIGETAIQIRIHFIKEMKQMNINWKRSVLINNIYLRQLKKIDSQIAKLHEDLQYDYRREIEGDE